MRPRPPHTLLSACLLLATATAQAPETVHYGRDVRPILSDRCFLCHGSGEHDRKAGLRLDERQFAIAVREHGAAIVPGDPAGSLLLQRVRHHDPDELMPPPDSNKARLSEAEVAVLTRWIEQGATYEAHWAFTPPVAPTLPAEGHPIDAFVGRALTANGLEPAPAAAPVTLARRAFLVLTGLPPTPAELDAFVADTRADRYQRLVDRLLTEEPYATRHAEHLASIWLDAGRYADTSGIHMDAGRQAWLWRDWLIDALRTDKPFDEFVVEQLAGDLLPDATAQQRTATGFLRNHVTTDEGGAINEEYLVEYAAERTETVGSVLLGLTVRCARCHDHKYDPFTQRDYYRLFSFFNNNEEPGLYSQSKDSNRALEPFLDVPTDAQQRELERLAAEIDTTKALRDTVPPEEQQAFQAFVDQTRSQLGLGWNRLAVRSATSSGGATLTIEPDGAVFGSGENPDYDRQVYTLSSDATDQRLFCVEALADERLPDGRVSRASHGNSVLSYVQLEVRPRGAGDDAWQTVPFHYALADVEQQNNDYGVGNALRDDDVGWAVAGHQQRGGRAAWFLTDRPFGFDGGTELRCTLAYQSRFPKHVLGRVRFSTSSCAERSLSLLPLWTTLFHTAGPFQARGKAALYDTAFGPEQQPAFDRAARFPRDGAAGPKPLAWSFGKNMRRDRTNALGNGAGVTYVAQRLFSPDAREVEVALGSDDGFQLYLDGAEVAERRVDRGVALDQDRAILSLTPGEHLLVLKVVNTGGAGGFAIQHRPHDTELANDLFLTLLPDLDAAEQRRDQLLHAYRTDRSPIYRERTERLRALEQQREQLQGQVPRAMVMQERAMARDTFVLTRGEYDKADPKRPVSRELPALFGSLPPELPRNRLGLARWLVSRDDPLLHRVAVNRLWEFVFGTGLVRTSEDFGRQGEWPSHPELLDWLATDFREHGHSVRRMLRLMVTSAAFRRDSRAGSRREQDPDDRLLSWYPRRRLTAEAIRDQALYCAGLLVERTGGASVKPYQPPGLWDEVAMRQSNTRVFRRDSGDALWRRSLYTYWKRACPPPSLLTFDAPTREFCTIRRSVTNTPLQALVLWNDEQFVEAARALASRTMRDEHGDTARLETMYRTVTGRRLADQQLGRCLRLLQQLRERYAADPDAARALVSVGEAPTPDDLQASELAAFTMLANAFLDLDATLYID